jgi:hypothetical protein
MEIRTLDIDGCRLRVAREPNPDHDDDSEEGLVPAVRYRVLSLLRSDGSAVNLSHLQAHTHTDLIRLRAEAREALHGSAGDVLAQIELDPQAQDDWDLKSVIFLSRLRGPQHPLASSASRPPLSVPHCETEPQLDGSLRIRISHGPSLEEMTLAPEQWQWRCRQ